jgi:hypothetical protein
MQQPQVVEEQNEPQNRRCHGDQPESGTKDVGEIQLGAELKDKSDELSQGGDHSAVD